MITSRSSLVHMPAGKYKLADVLKHITSERSRGPRRKNPAYREAYRKRDRERQKKRRENPVIREAEHEYHKRWYARKMMQK
jgi:hypothetical protein